MKIQLVSDLHLEFPNCNFSIQNTSNADVLILGGDITTAQALKDGLGQAEFFEEVCKEFPQVIYLMGNHEHYHSVFQETKSRLEKYLPASSKINLLEKDYLIIDDVVFFGATLWTDCNKNDKRTKEVLLAGMNDYRLIDYYIKNQDKYNHFMPVNTIEAHYETTEKLQEVCKKYSNKKIVVCTHHAPSKCSTHPRYASEKHMNGGYSSSLEWLMDEYPNIVLWTHGHTHSSFDYKLGNTRIVCNPRGYENWHHEVENKDFNPNLIIEI